MVTHQAVHVVTHQALHVGEVNLRVLGLLDEAHTETFGHPSPARVSTAPREGKAFLVYMCCV